MANKLDLTSLDCPFCLGSLQEDDYNLVTCQTCFRGWEAGKTWLTLIEASTSGDTDSG